LSGIVKPGDPGHS